MKLKFKLIHGKPNKDPNNFCLVIKDGYAEVVTHGREKFIQLKASWPGELEKMAEFFKQYIGEGFITTKRYLYIPSEWVYMDKRILYSSEEDDDDEV
jgi:hypothetical protein